MSEFWSPDQLDRFMRTIGDIDFKAQYSEMPMMLSELDFKQAQSHIEQMRQELAERRYQNWLANRHRRHAGD